MTDRACSSHRGRCEIVHFGAAESPPGAGMRPTKYVLDDRASGGVAERREICRGRAAFAGGDEDQAAVEAKAAAQPVGVSSSILEAGCVATRSRTSLKYREGSTPASLQPCARV